MEVNQDKQPFVTVITPLYNAEKYIAETIEGVINQIYQNWEMIIIDDCSSDNSRNIIKEYESKDNRIKLIKLESNFGGPARPRNIGLENAKGEYIAFLDADDVWLPQKLEKQIKFLQQHPDIDICHSLANVIDENSTLKGLFNNQNIFNKLKFIMKNQNIIYYANYININSVLMKINKEKRFSEDKNLVALEDWYFWIENMCGNMKVKLIEEKLLNYRIHSSSISLRKTDIGYRKSLYLLSLLLVNKKISIINYIFGSSFSLLKLILKNIEFKFSNKSKKDFS